MCSNVVFVYLYCVLCWMCDFDVVIIDESGCDLVCWIGNIFEGGFMVDCEDEIVVDSVIQVMLFGCGQVCVEICWMIGICFGVMIFDDQFVF